MTHERSEWETLNAYVDGELSTVNERAFERRIAEQPRLQEDLNEILELKGAFARMRPTMGDDKGQPSTRPTRGRRLSYAVAATFVGLAFVTIATILLAPDRTPGFEHAQALHDELARRAYVVEERYVVQTISSGRAFAFRPPDLTASRLYLVDVANSDGVGGETIAMHYRGLSGCRLTIVAWESGEPPPESSDRSPLTRTWHHGGFAFAVIANGMDADRFSAAADYAETVINAPTFDNDGQRIAMAETQRNARPCA